jgi:hypothetical protein
MKIGADDASEDTVSEITESDSTLISDMKDAKESFAELEAMTPVAELPASGQVAELPAYSKAIPSTELDAISTAKVELPA